MSSIGSFGKFLAGFLFVAGMVLSITTYNMIQLSSSDTLEDVTTELFETQMGEIQIGEGDRDLIEQFSEQCSEGSASEMFIDEDTEITCDDIESIESEGVTKFVVSKYIEGIQEKEYDCDVVECIVDEHEPLVLISNQAGELYREVLNYMVAFAAAMGIMFVLLSKGIKERLKGPGFALLWASVPFIITSVFIQSVAGILISELLPSEIGDGIASAVGPVAGALVGTLIMTYVYVAAVGAILVAVGFLVRPPVQKQAKKK